MPGIRYLLGGGNNIHSADVQPYMMRGITNLSDNGLGVGLERTRDDDEADECQVFLDVFATQLTNLKRSPRTQHDHMLFSMFCCRLFGVYG